MNDDIKKPYDLNLLPIDQELDALKAEELHHEHIAEDVEIEQPSFKLNSRRDERRVAFYLLYAIDRSDYNMGLQEALDTFHEGFELILPRGSFPLSVVNGVLEHRAMFDNRLSPHLKNWSLERLGCCTRLILHMAMWELEQPEAIPSIVINEAVELAKEFAEKDAFKFINGILDELSKEAIAAKASDE
jgi:transcription antitermination protein NusB